MDSEGSASKLAYLQVLIDTLEKKKNILKLLMNVTKQQEELIEAEAFDESIFDQTISIKEGHLNTLNLLDDGFETVYEEVKNELLLHKIHYRKEITALQKLIKDITDYSVELQALEKRNKTKLDYVFSGKRKTIRDSRISSRTVSNYYKTMSKQHETPSVFYDKKN